MRRLMSILTLALLGLLPLLAQAQTGPVTANPARLTLTGPLGNNPLAASLRLTASETLSETQLLVSDLLDATGDGRPRDPIPASAVTILPAAQFKALAVNSLTQIALQVNPPAVAGTYTGTLTVRWNKPVPGELRIPLTVIVRTQPVLVLQNPPRIALVALQGGQASRQILLRETIGGSPLTGLTGLSQDLITADGQKTLPAHQIKLTMPAGQIEGGGLLTANLTVDLQNVSPGAYSGQALFSADAGNLVPLPLTLSVRHKPFWPAVALISGVCLGLGLMIYLARGKRRDELILRLVAARQPLRDDAEFTAGFGPRAISILNQAEADINAARLTDARTLLDQAEAINSRWRSAREAWIAQLTYLRKELLPRLEGEAWTMRRLRQQVEDAQTNAADFESPSALRDRLFELEKILARFETLQKRLEEIGQARIKAPSSDEFNVLKEGWRIRQKQLDERLTAILPDDAESWRKLEADIQSLSQEIVKAIQSAPAVKGETRDSGGVWTALSSALQPSLPPGLLLPEAGPISIQSGQAARRRLQWYYLLAYFLGGLVLAGAGFKTLYLDNPVFGAQPITDYITLLAWGLGSQTTFKAAADWFQNLDLPFGKPDANA